MELKNLAYDPIKEDDGVWVDLYSDRVDEEPTKVKIRRIGSQQSKNYMTSWMKKKGLTPSPLLLDGGLLSYQEHRKFQVDILTDQIIVDWKNLTENGDALVFNKENCRRVLTEYEDFRVLVWRRAREDELFRFDEVLKKPLKQ